MHLKWDVGISAVLESSSAPVYIAVSYSVTLGAVLP